MKLPWKEKGSSTNVVVYKKQKKSKKHYMICTDIHVDVLNNGRAKKPIIDHKYDIIEMGMGEDFIEMWSEKYDIKKPKIIAK